MSGPDFSHENELIRAGAGHVCGVDEAGRGPLAGPVVAAAVILDPNCIPAGLDDSKKLSAHARTMLFEIIAETAHVAISSVPAVAIDRMNIRTASLEAMRRAVCALPVEAAHALIDGNALPPPLPCPATALVKGDGRSLSIAAASIVAKVARDNMIERAHTAYPGYGLAAHKGYPTAQHRAAVALLGPCPLHRRSFAPVAAAIEAQKGPRS